MWAVLTLDIRNISDSIWQLALLPELFGDSPQSVEENVGAGSFKFDYESVRLNLSKFITFVII
jgi:hypothetical protein